MKKFSTKLISLILSIAIILVSLPLAIFAKTAEEKDDWANEPLSNTYGVGNVDLFTYELTDRRDEYTKHFQNPDGTVTAIQYSVPLHTLNDDGAWESIDNTLLLLGDEYATADARIKFAKKTTGNETLFTLHDGNGKITMSLDGANKKVTGKITNYSADENAEDIVKMSHLEKLNSSIIYRNILDGVDLEYITVSNSIKENIIINSELDNYVFNFTMKLNNMTAIQDTDGGISVYNTSEELVYRITPPFMYDADSVYSYNVSYTLKSMSNNEYKITVAANEEWIESPERVFPITIDPSVSPSNSNIVDLFIDANQPDTNFNDSQLIFADNTCTIYWKVSELPAVPEFSHITDVSLSLFQANAGEAYIGVYRVTDDWPSTLTYTDVASGSFGSVDNTIVDYQKTCPTVSDSSTLTHVWNITDLASKWYDGTYSNYGICLKKVDETNVGQTDSLSFRSSEHFDIFTRARLIVTYKDQFGLEDYWSYASHSAGTAGSGHVNLATGNLVLNTGAMTTTDSLMPYTASAIYNSALAGRLFTRSNKNLPNGYTSLGVNPKYIINLRMILDDRYIPIRIIPILLMIPGMILLKRLKRAQIIRITYTDC